MKTTKIVYTDQFEEIEPGTEGTIVDTDDQRPGLKLIDFGEPGKAWIPEEELSS